jgi:hypothetical protein
MVEQPSKQKQNATVQIAILVAIFVVVINAAFYFLSGAYYDGKRGAFGAAPITDAQIQAARVQFGVFTAIVGAAAIAAAFRARLTGHVLAALIGVASLVLSAFAFTSSLPRVLPATLFLLGVLMPVLAWLSLARKSRAAWAFLLAMTVVYATVLFFGSPKVRSLLDIGLWSALIVPGLLVVSTVALALVRREYREV